MICPIVHSDCLKPDNHQVDFDKLLTTENTDNKTACPHFRCKLKITGLLEVVMY